MGSLSGGRGGTAGARESMDTVDTREFYRAPHIHEEAAAAAVQKVCNALPGDHRVYVEKLDPVSGAACVVASLAAEFESGSLPARALAHLRVLGPILVPDGDPAALDFVPDPVVDRTSSGVQIVRLHQHFQGVPVFEAMQSVVFDSNGRISRVMGESVQLSPDTSVLPVVPASVAAAEAARFARHGHRRTRRFAPAQVLTVFPLPSHPTVLRKRGFQAGLWAHLVLFDRRTEVRLGWRVLLAERKGEGPQELIVAADDATRMAILYAQPAVDTVRARGRVFLDNPGKDPELVSFPLGLESYPPLRPVNLPEGFPWDWIDEQRSTRGINAAAYLGNLNAPFVGRESGGDLLFDPDPGTENQRLLNAFYFCNYLHDFFYLLGFDEQAGNFQRTNFSRGPQGGEADELEIRIFDQPFDDGASMMSLQDGKRPQLELGLLPESNLHSALDADIVFHEFVHGVTNRIVGGRNSINPLRKPQSRALAEGYSDYFALTIQNHRLAPGEAKTVFGAWIAGVAGGIRREPYDGRFPGHFGLLGTADYREPHDAGEIWAATLILLNVKLGIALESTARGHELGWQVVFDSLKLLPVNPSSPSFLDGCDAILRALDDMVNAGRLGNNTHEDLRGVFLETFARFGMGPNARCLGAAFDGIESDPADPVATFLHK
jgi:extracellular elastinolytic metalloproteinase